MSYCFRPSVHIVCALFVAPVLTVGAGGCSAQGEGDRCTFFNNSADPSVNGTDECQDGLVCMAAFNTTQFPYDRCCPPNLAAATVPACEPNGAIEGGMPTSGRDASFDVSTDTKDAKTMDAKDATMPSLDSALMSLEASASGFGGFGLIVNDVVQHPLPCKSQHWEFAPFPASDAGACDASCPGVDSVVLVNTGALPMPYVVGSGWIEGAFYPPGVTPGGTLQVAGVLKPGAKVNITAVYQQGIVGAVGSAEPFSSLDATYASDEGTIPWPSGVAGSGGATTMYVAEIVVQPSCGIQRQIW